MDLMKANPTLIAAPRIVDRKGLADILGISMRTIIRLEECGLPRLDMRIPAVIRYDVPDVLAWIKSPCASSAEGTSQGGAR